LSQLFVFKVIYWITILISASAALIVWRKRDAPGALWLFLLMLAVLEWNFAGLMQLIETEMQTIILWSKISYLGVQSAPVFFLLFVLEYTHRQRWLTGRTISLLFIMPVLTTGFAFTNEWHMLIWSGFSTAPDGSSLIYHHGVWFWLSAAAINVLLLAGAILLFRFGLHSRELYLSQNIAIMIGALFPWAAFILYAVGIEPFPGVDTIALSFTVTGVILVYIITRMNFLDVIPVAREVLVDTMPDGLLVLDDQNRLIDINPSALKIFQISPTHKWIGRPAREVLSTQTGLEQQLESDGKVVMEWVQNLPEPRYFDLQIFPLFKRSGKLSGKTIVLRDITRRKNSETALQTAYHQLEERLEQIQKLQDELRDQSIRDALTGLFNRRYIDEIFAGEVARAERENHLLSLIIIDLDHFKEINDTYGHARGDECLRKLGRAFRAHFRISDIVCRYGGDEFILIIPHSSVEDAFQRIEAFRQAQHQILFDAPEAALQITFSAGICTYPTHAKTSEDLFRIADQMLYHAKANGRNQTCAPASNLRD